MNRAVKVRLLANYLVKECGLISWLSTIVSSYGQQLDGGKKEISLKAMTCALKVNLTFMIKLHGNDHF